MSPHTLALRQPSNSPLLQMKSKSMVSEKSVLEEETNKKMDELTVVKKQLNEQTK